MSIPPHDPARYGELRDRVRAYYDAFRTYLDNDLKRPNPRHERVIQALRRLIQPGHRVLDLGCGIGITTRAICGMTDGPVVGVDLSPRLIERAREICDATFHVHDITELSLGATFDVLCIIDTLEHLPPFRYDALWGVLEAHAAPGALLYVNIPNPRLIAHLQDEQPEALQIIDESVPMDALVAHAYRRRFTLLRVDTYSLWQAEDYVELVFRFDGAAAGAAEAPEPAAADAAAGPAPEAPAVHAGDGCDRHAVPPGPAPIRLGVWAADGDNLHFLDPILDRLPPRYEVHRFSYHPGRPLDALQAEVAGVDMAWFEWATGPVVPGSRLVRDVPALCRLHRYEAYTDIPRTVTWQHIDRLMFISDGVRDTFASFHKGLLPATTQTVVVPNAVDLDAFPFEPRARTFNLAFLGRLHLVKNPMLLLQILKRLVEIDARYVLHVAGAMQHVEVGQYLEYHVRQMGLQDHFAYYGALEPDEVQAWLAQCSYLLSTSVIEGHPVGVMEAMAQGLKPVIHDFIGARALFPGDYLFNSIDEAVAMITADDFEPARYRQFVADRYDLNRQAEAVTGVLDRLASDYYPARMAACFAQARAGRYDRAGEAAETLFARALETIEQGDLDAAAPMLERLPFDALAPDDALVARAYALQVATARGAHTDALFHADAALDLAADEPLIHHLMGQALWARGHQRAAAEALVHAAEVIQALEDARQAPRLPVDAVAVYFMAGEACRHFEQHEAARAFFERARLHAPDDEALAEALAAVQHA